MGLLSLAGSSLLNETCLPNMEKERLGGYRTEVLKDQMFQFSFFQFVIKYFNYLTKLKHMPQGVSNTHKIIGHTTVV